MKRRKGAPTPGPTRAQRRRAAADDAYRRALGVPDGAQLPRDAGTSGRTPAASPAKGERR